MNNQQAKKIREAIEAILGTPADAIALREVQKGVLDIDKSVRGLTGLYRQLAERITQLEQQERPGPINPEFVRQELIKQAKEIQELKNALFVKERQA